MGCAAYGEAHVAHWEEQVLFVLAADMIQQWQTRVWMDHIIVLANDIQHWTRDTAEVNAVLAYLQLAAEELILAKEVDTQFVK